MQGSFAARHRSQHAWLHYRASPVRLPWRTRTLQPRYTGSHEPYDLETRKPGSAHSAAMLNARSAFCNPAVMRSWSTEGSASLMTAWPHALAVCTVLRAVQDQISSFYVEKSNPTYMYCMLARLAMSDDEPLLCLLCGSRSRGVASGAVLIYLATVSAC
jgi:hypothetical protein